MSFETSIILISLGLLVGMTTAIEVGRRIGLFDLLPADAQPPLRELFRAYVDARLETYAHTGEESMSMTHYAEAVTRQERNWDSALGAARRPDSPPASATLLLPAINEMGDIATTRLVAVRNHPPAVVFILLFSMCLIGALLVGYNGAANKGRSVFHSTLYSIVMVLAIYVILDLEYPRLGLIRIDKADAVLIELRQSMG